MLIKRFFNPSFPRWRRVLPRTKYTDADYLIEDSLFALVLDFWYEEGRDHMLSIEQLGEHKETASFYGWLMDMVIIIEKTIPDMEKELDKLQYANIAELLDKRKRLEEYKTEILIEIIKHRKYMWT
jgi:hypothetical protein